MYNIAHMKVVKMKDINSKNSKKINENFKVRDIIKLLLILKVKTKIFIQKKEKIEDKDQVHRYHQKANRLNRKIKISMKENLKDLIILIEILDQRKIIMMIEKIILDIEKILIIWTIKTKKDFHHEDNKLQKID